MRDFFIHQGQTNLELYAQPISHGYSSDQCRVLADEIEDVCGYALALHGNTGTDDFGLRGGYPWRRNAKTAEAATLIELIHRLRLDGLHRRFSHWLDFESTPAALAEMCTGWQNRAFIVIAR
jgi:hypothetical protein